VYANTISFLEYGELIEWSNTLLIIAVHGVKPWRGKDKEKGGGVTQMLLGTETVTVLDCVLPALFFATT
jgi:hypothetical protein